MKSSDLDVLIVGAGAAGMMCAIEAGKRGRRVRVIDHARAPGEKIRISGGGRCNFTNLGTSGANFLSENPRFALSALKRFTQHDFLKMVERHGIAWHEKTHEGGGLGQLFCDDSAKQIIRMLTDEMKAAGATLSLGLGVKAIARDGQRFTVDLDDGTRISTASLVVATGGKSIPKMGATGWGYDVARQFDLRVTETRPALVPLTFEPGLLEQLKPLAGVAVDAIVRTAPNSASSSPKGDRPQFKEAMLFTHRGLSGPSILQISSYWREGEAITVDMAPGEDVAARLLAAKTENGKQAVHTALGHIIPRGPGRQAGRGRRQEAASHGRDGQRLDRQAGRVRGLSHGRGDPGRGRHRRPGPADDGGQVGPRPLLHRRGRRRHRLAGRL